MSGPPFSREESQRALSDAIRREAQEIRERTLLPCPFCGTKTRDDEQELGLSAWLQVNEIAGPLFSIECFGCGVETQYANTEEEAIAAWNRRQPLAERVSIWPTLRRARRVGHDPLVDLRALPILWQVEVIRDLRPPVAIRAHRHALAMVFRDHTEAFCRGFDLVLDGVAC